MFELEVNGELIPISLVEHELEQLREANLKNSEQKNDGELVEELKQDLATRVILRQEALKRNYAIEEDLIEQALAKLIEENGGEEAFYQHFSLSKNDDSRIREDISNNLKVDELLGELSEKIPSPSEITIKQYYKQNEGQLFFPEEAHISHIVKDYEQEPDVVYQEMVEIRQQLLSGADFANTADTHSHTESPGGDLGFVQQGHMIPEIDAVAFSMNANEISPVFQSEFGYHIIKVHAKKMSKEMNYEDARPMIKEQLYYDLKNEAIGKWVDEKLKAAKIIVNEVN